MIKLDSINDYADVQLWAGSMASAISNRPGAGAGRQLWAQHRDLGILAAWARTAGAFVAYPGQPLDPDWWGAVAVALVRQWDSMARARGAIAADDLAGHRRGWVPGGSWDHMGPVPRGMINYFLHTQEPYRAMMDHARRPGAYDAARLAEWLRDTWPATWRAARLTAGADLPPHGVPFADVAICLCETMARRDAESARAMAADVADLAEARAMVADFKRRRLAGEKFSWEK